MGENPVSERPDLRSDRGITLVELLVAISILAVLLTMVSGFFTASMRIVSSSQALSQGTGTASNAMNELARVIRSGTDNPVVSQSQPNPAFLQATAESLTMYSYVDSYASAASTDVRPQLVQFSLDTNRQLVEKRWIPNASASQYFTFPSTATPPTTTRTIAGPLLSGAPLFTYFTASGATLTPPAAGFSVDEFRSIASVRVTVSVKGDQNAGHAPVQLQNTVRIPNLGFTED